ncbi:hypothetical protein [Vibrio sp. D431a]|uniref:hypothetical protein n=1 Tax=Vibrio sp. D431a TaxID=2837388 RepID=UPI002553DF11|nr:hypothetical protein [Vibrio sp. D431a]MDK9793309.1 hypothetical protein [Vibrio sp. D431a]
MSIEIAKTILSQIKNSKDEKGVSGTQLIMCWGAHDFCAYPHEENKHYGGITFKVQGHYHRGRVRITFNGSDTYDIAFLSVRGKVKHEANGIYCDMLLEVIDSYVETNRMNDHNE